MGVNGKDEERGIRSMYLIILYEDRTINFFCPVLAWDLNPPTYTFCKLGSQVCATSLGLLGRQSHLLLTWD
jgi:hypothetical protein